MAYVILTVAQGRNLADTIEARLNAEIQREGTDLGITLPHFTGVATGLRSSNPPRIIVDTGDDDTIAGPKTVVVLWRDPTDPPHELWVLYLFGPSARLLPLGLFVCDAIISQFGANWTAKWGLGTEDSPLQYGRRFANIVGATIGADGVARQNIQVCRNALAAVTP